MLSTIKSDVDDESDEDSDDEEETEEEEGTVMPFFSQEALEGMRVAELRSICKTYHIKQGKKKEGFISNIFQCSETLYNHGDEVRKVQRSFH